MVDEISVSTYPVQSLGTNALGSSSNVLIALSEDKTLKKWKRNPPAIPRSLLAVNSGTVYGGVFSVKDAQSRFITESITINGESNLEKHYDNALKFEVQTTLALDTPAIVVGNRAHNNYYHWHINCLPAVLLACELKLPWPLIVPKLNDWQRESLKLFNFPSSRIIELQTGTTISSPRLYIPSAVFNEYKHVGLKALSALHRLADERFGDVIAHRKVYLARWDTKSRELLNERDFATALETIGFEVIAAAELSYFEQVKLLLETKHLVSCHGAGLTNIIWLPDSASVFEIRPEFWNQNMYENISRILKLDYQYHIEEGKPIRVSRWNIKDIPKMLEQISKQFED